MISSQQSLLRDVGIDLSGGQIPMAEQLLNATEICPPVKQMRGEAMSERMRAGRVYEPATHQMRLEKPPDTSSAQTRAILVEEDGLFANELGPAKPNPFVDPVNCHGTDGIEPLAPPFATDPN